MMGEKDGVTAYWWILCKSKDEEDLCRSVADRLIERITALRENLGK
jgi:hypothetical protein